MLRCSGCHQDKPETEFHRSSRMKRGYQSQCKECNKQAVLKHIHNNPGHNQAVRKARRDDLARRVREWKRERGCACCPENEPVCLELHHLDPTTKEAQPSDLIRRSWEAFIEEAKKCIILCSNCHKKYHAGLIELPPHSSA